jgi:hypothetical protein
MEGMEGTEGDCQGAAVGLDLGFEIGWTGRVREGAWVRGVLWWVEIRGGGGGGGRGGLGRR